MRLGLESSGLACLFMLQVICHLLLTLQGLLGSDSSMNHSEVETVSLDSGELQLHLQLEPQLQA